MRAFCSLLSVIFWLVAIFCYLSLTSGDFVITKDGVPWHGVTFLILQIYNYPSDTTGCILGIWWNCYYRACNQPGGASLLLLRYSRRNNYNRFSCRILLDNGDMYIISFVRQKPHILFSSLPLHKYFRRNNHNPALL